ncbi:MAG: transglutaminase family protein [Defluviitaleaceae bacterium]|nr:transglutaminase family protein [Defluviitaleaceae bacterium]
MKLQYEDINRYLESSEIIDFHTSPEIAALSREIAARSKDKTDFAKNAFEYVRDEISHTNDIGGDVVTYKASEVLRERQGVCYAKSHLLAAILRCGGTIGGSVGGSAVKLPTGICYQALIWDDDDPHPYLVLHALNAVFIQDKWIRLDARGNKPGVDAQFSLEEEKLAFPVRPEKGETDFPTIYATPDENVIRALINNKNAQSLWSNLPRELKE